MHCTLDPTPTVGAAETGLASLESLSLRVKPIAEPGVVQRRNGTVRTLWESN